MSKGTFRAYEPPANLRKSTLDWIHAANHILNDFEGKGHQVTVRQLYYQFVSLGYTDGVNNKGMYERLQTVLNTGRMQGLISWTAIEDRERNLRGLNTYSNPSEAFATARADYRLDLWADQQWRPEVWIEKQALSGVIANICNKLRVNFFACKGYNSQSEQWRAGQRFANYVRKGQRPIVFHLGDHDPSGLDMTRDNRDRLEQFAGVPVLVQRLALTMKQVEEFNPPPNYAKPTDARYEGYKAEYGEDTWELDALTPTYLEELIESNVRMVRDEHLWNDSLLQENADLREMDLMIQEMKHGGDDDESDD